MVGNLILIQQPKTYLHLIIAQNKPAHNATAFVCLELLI